MKKILVVLLALFVMSMSAIAAVDTEGWSIRDTEQYVRLNIWNGASGESGQGSISVYDPENKVLTRLSLKQVLNNYDGTYRYNVKRTIVDYKNNEVLRMELENVKGIYKNDKFKLQGHTDWINTRQLR